MQLLNLLISRTTSPTRRLLYLLLRDRTITRQQAGKHGIENLEASLFALRQKGWVISNPEQYHFKLVLRKTDVEQVIENHQ